MRQVILNFHGIGTPQRAMEPGEAPYWVSPEFFAQILELAEHHKAHVQTDFTFDDGNLSDLEIAAPQLARHALKATFFVLADRIGNAGSLNTQDIKLLVAEGHKIGTHGAAHVDWKAADAKTLERELGTTTRYAIADAAGQTVTAAAIPFGRYNAAVLKALRDLSYEKVYSSDGGSWHSRQLPIPRTSLRFDMTLIQIENILLGREPGRLRLRRLLARRIKSLV